MKLDKKIQLWSVIYKATGAVTAISFIQDNKFWTIILGVLLAVSSEMKDYYLKKQNKEI